MEEFDWNSTIFKGIAEERFPSLKNILEGFQQR